MRSGDLARVVVEGRGLHRGELGRVILSACDGPSTFGAHGVHVPIVGLSLVGGDRSTRAAVGNGVEIETVEHLLAAIVGLDAFYGVAIEVEGREVPIVDGCARVFADAIVGLMPADAVAASDCVVVRNETMTIDGATYRWSPSPGTDVEISVDYAAERFGRPVTGCARWDGDRTHFLDHIATARTFGAARELAALRDRGLAAHVPEGSVVALDLDDPRWAARDADEPIRHKLLDLIGDLAGLGGRLVGALTVDRPSHAATSRAVAIARSSGLLARAGGRAISMQRCTQG